MAKKEKVPLDKSVLTFFLIAFPTILIIIVGLMASKLGWVIQIALAIYQFLVLKQFVDNYYDLMEIE